jgi:hypothetical protein
LVRIVGRKIKKEIVEPVEPIGVYAVVGIDKDGNDYLVKGCLNESAYFCKQQCDDLNKQMVKSRYYRVAYLKEQK